MLGRNAPVGKRPENGMTNLSVSRQQTEAMEPNPCQTHFTPQHLGFDLHSSSFVIVVVSLFVQLSLAPTLPP